VPLVTLHGEDVVVPADTVCRSVHKGQESSRPAANPLPPGVHVVLPKLERGGSVGGDQVLQVELEEPRSCTVWVVVATTVVRWGCALDGVELLFNSVRWPDRVRRLDS